MTTTLHWNNVLLELSRRDFSQGYAGGAQGGPTKTSRAMAMTHLAIYNAVAAFKQPSAMYLRSAKIGGGKINITLPNPTSKLSELIDGAAHTMLSHLYKRQQQLINMSAMTRSKRQGFIDGQKIADAIFNDRTNDGSEAPNPMARPTDSPDYGKHKTDPYEAGQAALGMEWGKVVRFCHDKRICVAPFPGIGSTPLIGDPDFKLDYNEVKDMGSRGKTSRTADESAIGVYWGYDGANNIGVPPRMYNQIARVIIDARIDAGDFSKDDEALQELQISRLMATINCAMADAGIDAWYAKYVNDLWRPVVGIRNEERAYSDPFWAPVGAPQTNKSNNGPRTPPFPAYPSGHATFGAALFQVLAKSTGGEITLANVLAEENSEAKIANQSFEFTSDELDGIAVDTDGSMRTRAPRKFESYARAVYENAVSRVYLGVHWRFDGLSRTQEHVGGVPLGLKVSKQAFELFDTLAKTGGIKPAPTPTPSPPPPAPPAPAAVGASEKTTKANKGK